MRTTRTNSGPDSKGVVRLGRWEFPGEAYLFVVAGAIGSVLAFALAAGQPLFLRVLISASPLLAALLWIKGFILGKAPHYLGDFVEKALLGPHFDLSRKHWARQRAPHVAKGK